MSGDKGHDSHRAGVLVGAGTGLLLLACCALPLLIFFVPSLQMQMTLILLLLLFGMAVIAYLNSFFLVKIFDKYIPENSEEDADGGRS